MATQTGDDRYVTFGQYKLLSTQVAEQFAKKTEVPTNVSQLTNDANYQNNTEVDDAISSALDGIEVGGSVEVPTKVSELINDAGYQTATEVQSTVDTAIDENITQALNASY